MRSITVFIGELCRSLTVTIAGISVVEHSMTWYGHVRMNLDDHA
jgi:hypothetical protein